jgi:hypothetical protein
LGSWPRRIQLFCLYMEAENCLYTYLESKLKKIGLLDESVRISKEASPLVQQGSL